VTCRCGQQKRCTPLVSLVPLVLGGSPRLVGQAAGRLVGGKSAPISREQRMTLHTRGAGAPLSGLTVPNRCRPAPQAMRPGPSGGLEVLVGRANWLPAPRRTAPVRQGSGGRALRGWRRTNSRDPPLDLDCDPCARTSRVLWAFQSFAEGRNTNKPTRPSGFRVLRFRTNAVAFNLHQSRGPVPLRARCSEQRKGRTRPVPAASIA